MWEVSYGRSQINSTQMARPCRRVFAFQGVQFGEGGKTMPGGGGTVATEDKLVEIQIQLARMEKTLEAVPTLTITIETTRDLAREAMQSTKSAHHRLDRIEDGQRWLWRTIGGSIITVVAAAIVVAIRLGGN